MMSISSAAGKRLAKARYELGQSLALKDGSKEQDLVIEDAIAWFHAAAEDVADELVEQRFHLMEGD